MSFHRNLFNSEHICHSVKDSYRMAARCYGRQAIESSRKEKKLDKIMSQITINKSSRKTFWTVAAFYGLITFEFFYMASPFAVYFYSIYRPGLNLISSIPGMSWLLGFFLPHIAAETSSPFINIHNKAGAVIAAFGLLIFCVSAGQVYYAKLRKKGAVTGGIYKYIRHPQYAAFAVCSFGLLLLWPRYLVLIMFITIMFAYYFLAKLEERECEAKFG